MSKIKITGTLIWYYYICKREVWLISHGINADQRDDNIEIGKFLHENSFSRNKKEFEIHGMKIDIIKSEKGKLIVGEIKKTSKFKRSARMQLLLYLSELADEGYNATGVLMFPREKKREEVCLDEDSIKELEKAKEAIKNIAGLEKPPKPEKIKYCGKCAYSEFCWS
jgi:CRISPR-associated exonuclease Cas4